MLLTSFRAEESFFTYDMIMSIHSQNKAEAANKTLILANTRWFCLHGTVAGIQIKEM